MTTQTERSGRETESPVAIAGFQYVNRHAYEDAAPTLRYGRMWGSFKVIGCKSTKTGLTCKNRRGHGWTIGKVSYKLF